jgi:hypothetical protein
MPKPRSRKTSEHDPVRLGRRWDRLSARSCSANKKGSGTPAGASVQTSAPYGRGSREASRARLSASHHGACGSEPTPPLSSRTRFLGRGAKRALPVSTCPTPATKSQTGHHAGRASSRSRPGAEVTSRRPREPLSLRQPVSPAGVLYGSEIRGVVTEMGTGVKNNVTFTVTFFSAIIRGLDPRIHAAFRHITVLRRARLCWTAA